VEQLIDPEMLAEASAPQIDSEKTTLAHVQTSIRAKEDQSIPRDPQIGLFE